MRCAVVLLLVLAGELTAHADVNTKDSSGWTALQHAAMDGKVAEIDRLLAAGADLEASSPNVYDGATAFVVALHFTQHDAAKRLLDRGASIAGKLGQTALELGARDGDDDIVAALVRRKVRVAGTHALHLAARYGRAAMIATLVKQGAGIDDPSNDDHDFTPLMYACMENRLDAAKVLVAAGAKIDRVDAEGVTALHWAVYAARSIEVHRYRKLGPHDTTFTPQTSAPIVDLLIRHKAKLDAVDAHGNTPLHDAAMLDVAPAARALVAAGANRAVRNTDGKTAHQLAKDRNNSVEPIVRARNR